MLSSCPASLCLHVHAHVHIYMYAPMWYVRVQARAEYWASSFFIILLCLGTEPH